jgi:hypothetical protein
MARVADVIHDDLWASYARCYGLRKETKGATQVWSFRSPGCTSYFSMQWAIPAEVAHCRKRADRAGNASMSVAVMWKLPHHVV